MKVSLLLAWVQRNGLRIVAALALLALSGVLAAYNANGWLAKGLALLATLALITEALAFVMAVIADGAARSRQWLKLAICVLILFGAEAFNAAGSHMAWEADIAPKLDADRRTAQAALDHTRSTLQTELAEVNSRIPAPPAQRGGPQTTEADLATWRAATADDRTRRTALQARLDALPIVAEVEPPFSPGVVWGFLIFLGFAKAFGLFAVGMTVGAKSQGSGSNVVEFDASEAARRLVGRRKDRQAVA